MEDILIFVEDTGAAQMVLGLASAKILATGNALDALQYHGLPHEALAPSAQAVEILQRYKPRLVAVGTGENQKSFSFELIKAARAVKLPTMGLVDAIVSARHRFQGTTNNPLAYLPDWLIVPDDATRAEYMALGVSEKRIKVIGYVQVDTIYEASKTLQRQVWPQATGRPVLVFIAETLGGIVPDDYQQSPDYTLTGRGKHHDRTRIVLEEVLDVLEEIKPRPYIILRLHPKNTPEEFTDYAQEIDFISQKEPALAVVAGADVVIGMTSTLMFEAAILGRPTLSIIPRVQERAWLPSVVAGLTPQVTTRSQIKSELKRLLESPNQQPGLPTEALGKAGARERLTQNLIHLANSSK